VSTMGWLRGGEDAAHTGWEREALERAAAGVLLIDAGRIVYANAHAAALFGHSTPALVGRDTSSLLDG